MSDAQEFTDAVLGAVVEAVRPLEHALANEAVFFELVEELGWLPPAGPVDTQKVGQHLALAAPLAAARAALDVVRQGPTPTPAQIAALVDAVTALVAALHDFASRPVPVGVPDPLGSPTFWTALAADLVGHLITRYLERENPLVFAVLLLLGVIDSELVTAPSPDRSPEHERTVFRWDRLPRFVSDPGTIPAEVYGWGTAFDHRKLLARLARALVAAGLPAQRTIVSQDEVDTHFGLDVRAPSGFRKLQIPLFMRSSPEGYVEVGVAVLPIPRTPGPGAIPDGVLVGPYARAAIGNELEIRPHLVLRTAGFVDVSEPAGIVILPGVARPFGSVSTTSARIGLQLVYAPDAPWRGIGGAQGTNVTVESAGFGLDLSMRGTATELRLTASVEGLRLTMALAEGDSFVKSVTGGRDAGARMSGAVVWSSTSGLSIDGGSGLQVTVPLNVQLALIELRDVVLRAASVSGALGVTAAVSGTATLGPLRVSVAGIGARLSLVPDPSGPVAGLRATIAFKPPDGVGVSIDSNVVTGGGFLSFDADRAQYSGALHLDAEGVALNAIGLLTTRLPGGQPGYSLLVIITASGFQPIPLGFGFTLTGVGGLLGINRDVALDPLQAGLRSGALDPILFTRDDPTPRAATIIDTLQAVFPPAPDRHVVGPMAQISWGSPPVLSIDVALLLQFPAPLRLVLLGRLRAALPHDKAAVVLLNMDVFGVIDFDRGTAAVDAVLRDSMVAGFALTGQMAMRISWRQDPGFTLAVGGFHPRFAAPPGFPKLQRLALTLAAGDNPRLRLEAYLALTSNTVQLGGRLDFAVRAGEFSLEGVFALDTLVHLAPFELSADLAALLALKQGVSVLMAVAVTIALTGPAPWHVHGQATLQVAGLSLPPLPIDATFGEPRPLPLPPAIDLWAEQLQPALSDIRNWTGQLPPGGQSVRLAPRPLAPGEMLLHPRGSLTIRQRVVPFDRDLDRFGTRPLAGARRFSVAALLVDGVAQPTPALRPVVDDFAPAQFRRLADDEALAAPSFDRMPSGVTVAPATAVSGAPVAKRLVYKTVIRGATGNRPGPAFVLPAERVAPLAAAGAAGTAATRATGRARYAGAPLGIRVERPGYVVATRSDLRQQAAGDGSYSGAVDALRRSIPVAQRAGVQIVRRQEVIA